MTVALFSSTADQPGTSSIALPSGGASTSQYTTHQVDNVVVPVNGLVLATMRDEFTTGGVDANWNAAGYYAYNGQKTEHWSLWVMCAWGMQRSSDGGINWTWLDNGHQHAENINSEIHHLPVSWSVWDRPAAGTYSYRTRCYFSCSGSYWRSGACVGVEQGYGAIEVAVLS